MPIVIDREAIRHRYTQNGNHPSSEETRWQSLKASFGRAARNSHNAFVQAAPVEYAFLSAVLGSASLMTVEKMSCTSAFRCLAEMEYAPVRAGAYFIASAAVGLGAWIARDYLLRRQEVEFLRLERERSGREPSPLGDGEFAFMRLYNGPVPEPLMTERQTGKHGSSYP